MTTTMAKVAQKAAEAAAAARAVARVLSIPACSVRASIHTCSAWHLNLVTEYRVAREAAEQAREAAVGLYGPGSEEWSDWMSTHTMVTFKDWLIGIKESAQ